MSMRKFRRYRVANIDLKMDGSGSIVLRFPLTTVAEFRGTKTTDEEIAILAFDRSPPSLMMLKGLCVSSRTTSPFEFELMDEGNSEELYGVVARSKDALKVDFVPEHTFRRLIIEYLLTR